MALPSLLLLCCPKRELSSSVADMGAYMGAAWALERKELMSRLEAMSVVRHGGMYYDFGTT